MELAAELNIQEHLRLAVFRSERLILLQAVSKIVANAQEQGKGRRKSAAYVQYVSILRRLLTQLLSVRCIFEMACRRLMPLMRCGLFLFWNCDFKIDRINRIKAIFSS
jgi:predicted ATPase